MRAAANPMEEGEFSTLGRKVEEGDTLCLRQIHPNFVDKGRLTEMAFRLKETDKGLLSVSLTHKTTPAEAFELYTSSKEAGGKGLSACGTWAVSVAECGKEQLEVFEDPRTEPVPDPAHGSIDLRHIMDDKDKRKTKQQQLRAYAQVRGQVYPPKL